MKAVKRLSVLLAVLLVLSIAVVGFVVSADDATVITVTDEASFNEAMVEANASATIVLANDITLTNGNTTMPGTFTGTFDGQGYTLAGMTQTLFNKLSGATVKNAKFDGAITSDNRKAATIAYDEQDNSVIKDIVSYVDITMAANDLNAGGIIGYGKSVTFENVTYAGDYVATWGGAGAGVGGIIGYTNNNGTANYINCSFTGTMTVNGEATGMLDLGAIIGIARNGENNFEGCVNAGSFTVTAPATTLNVSAVVGRNRDNSATINVKNCFNYGTASEGVTVAGVIASGEVAVNEGNITAIPVATADEFRAAMVEANNAAYIILTADIDLGEAGNTTMGGTFTGTFDGQGYTISGVTATLFPKISKGTVKNVTINGAITGGNRDIGTLSVRAEGSLIENVTSNVNITLTGEQGDLNAGGIVGYGKATTFTNCTYAGTYTVENGGGGGFGGIVGYVNNSYDGADQACTYTDCAFTGAIVVNGTKTGTLNLGAIVGRAKSGALTIIRPTVTGTITLNNAACGYNFGGIGGSLEDQGTTISGAFVAATVVKGEGVTKDMTLFYGNGTITSATGAGKMADGSYLANDGEGLAAVFKYMPADATVKVNADVTLPAGTPTAMIEYAGTLDGQGYTVSGLSNPLFKKIVGGTVKNITFEGNVDFTDESVDNKTIRRYATTIAFEAKNVTLENVISNVNITVIGTDLNAGGLIGYANEATLTNCTYAGTYNATGDGAVGGLIGYVRTNSGTNTYTDCAFTGTINFDGVAEGKTVYIGGLIGKHRQHTVVVDNFTNTGVINVTNNAGNVYVGGFIGTDNDVASLTMSGTFDGTINAEGATVDSFLADDAGAAADLSGCVAVVPFAEGTITATGAGTYTIGSDGFSAFVSMRKGAEGTIDYRFIVAANKEAFAANKTMNMVLTFTKDGEVVKTTTKNVQNDLALYYSATAAGNTYTAADGSLLFGLVVTGVPAEAWDTVTVKLVDGETLLGIGNIGYADTMGAKIAVDNYGFENHHADLDYRACWVVNTGDLDLITGINEGIYTFVVYINGEAYEITDFSLYGTNWIRMDLETAGVTNITKGTEYTAMLEVYDEAGDILYYTETFTITSGSASTDTAQAVEVRGLESFAVNTETIVAEGISTWGDGAVGNLFDGNLTGTKLGGGVGDDGTVTVTFSLTEAKTATYYALTTGGDTANNTHRNPDSWTLYGKVGEEWVVLSEITDTNHTGLFPYNSTTYSWAIAEPKECIDYKIVFKTDSNQMQLNELQLLSGTPAQKIEASNYGIENHHSDIDNHAAWVVYVGVDGLAKKVVDGEYTAKVSVNGKTYDVAAISSYIFDDGNGYLRLDLEAMGVTNIKPGNEYTFELSVYGAEGQYLYYTYEYDVTSTVFSTDVPAQNIDALPEGLTQVTVKADSITTENFNQWGDGESAAKIFDGDKEGTKMGGGTVDGQVTLYFALEAPAKLTYYTFTTGGDSGSYGGRNPSGWVLYGKVGEEWVALSTVGVNFRSGLQDVDKTPFYYLIDNQEECTEYKLVMTTGGSFQMNELELFTGVSYYGTDIPAAGLAQVTVDVDSVQFSVDSWASNLPKHAFDGDTVNSKLGTPNTLGQPVTLEFSLTEAATITYYTFWTGNDTLPRYGERNPVSWTLYGKVGEEWVVLSKISESGMNNIWATPYSYGVANPVECKDYKIVFETTSGGVFQLNEIVLFKNDATVTTPTAGAIMEGAIVAFPHALGYDADAYRIRTVNKADAVQFGNEAMAEITKDGAYVWVKDVTNNGVYTRYEVKELETARHCDLNVILDGFTPVAGNQYEFMIFFMTGASAANPNALHVLHFFFTIPQ